VVTPRLAAGLLTPALAAFADEHPDVAVTVEMLARPELERWIAREQFDLGLSALPVNNPVVQSEFLFEVPAVVAMPRDHPLAGRRAVRADDLREERWVSTIKGTRIRAEMDDLFQQAGLEPAVHVEASNTIIASLLAASGVGLMLTDPVSARAIAGDRLRMPRWEPPHCMRYGVILPRTRSPSPTAELFLDVVRRTVREVIAEWELSER
jgi:DNA-binding transcriptional LysR family regulator